MPTEVLTIINRVLVAMNFPKSVPKFILYARAIHDSMKANPIFAALLSKLATLKTNIDTLDDNELASKTRPPSKSKAERDASLEVVKKDLRELGRDVQTLADDDPANAESTIVAAKMDIKKQVVHQKQGNTAKNGPQSGTVLLTGKGKGPHNWRMSQDNINWTLLPASLGSKTVVTGLKPKEEYYFQNCMVKNNGETGEWSQSIKIVVL